MIQIYLKRNAFQEEECDGMEGAKFSIKIVRAKTYTKVVIYDFDYLPGFIVGYHGNNKITKKYINGIIYQKKQKRLEEF